MKSLIIVLIYAFIVISESRTVDKKNQNEEPLDLVLISQDNDISCSGTVLRDNTILVITACLYGGGSNIDTTRIVFPNDKRTFKPKDIITDGDITIIILDEKEQPPKCKSNYQLRKSDDSKGVGEMYFIIDDKKHIEKESVWVTDLKECMEQYGINPKKIICLAVKGELRNYGPNWIVGSPWINGGLLSGIFKRGLGSDETPIAFIKLDAHFSFLEKYVNNLAKDGKPKNDDTRKNKHL